MWRLRNSTRTNLDNLSLHLRGVGWVKRSRSRLMHRENAEKSSGSDNMNREMVLQPQQMPIATNNVRCLNAKGTSQYFVIRRVFEDDRCYWRRFSLRYAWTSRAISRMERGRSRTRVAIDESRGVSIFLITTIPPSHRTAILSAGLNRCFGSRMVRLAGTSSNLIVSPSLSNRETRL